MGDLLECLDQPGSASDRCPALADPHRRRVLRHVGRREAPVHLADLARELARQADGNGENEPDAKTDTQSIYVGLYHNHVPRLADAGLVSFDADRMTVTLADG